MSHWGRYWQLRAQPFEDEFLNFPSGGMDEHRWQQIVTSARELGDHDAPPLAPLLEIDGDPPAGDPVTVFRHCIARCCARAVAASDVIGDMNPCSDDLTGVLTELRKRGPQDLESLTRLLAAIGWDGGPVNPAPRPWWATGAYESDHWVGLVPPREVAALWEEFAGRRIDALVCARRPALSQLIDLIREAAQQRYWLLAVESCG